MLADFVFLYLFHKSNYVYLDQSFSEKPPFRESAKKYEPFIRSKVAKYCKNRKITANCILDSMKSQFKIKVSFGRYDEHQFNES